MEVFFYELIFFLFALILRAGPIVALFFLARWIYRSFKRMCGRIRARRRRAREREARKAIYRRRSAEYRKGCLKCYRRE